MSSSIFSWPKTSTKSEKYVATLCEHGAGVFDVFWAWGHFKISGLFFNKIGFDSRVFIMNPVDEIFRRFKV